jgi:hypothetical protein
MWLFWIFIPAKYKLIHARTVAQAMVNAAARNVNGIQDSGQIRKLGKPAR